MTHWSWDNLRFLLAVGEHGTLSEAARHLDVSHTTVQRRLAMFEKEVNASLLSKTTHGYTLTEAGQVLYLHARRFQESLDNEVRQIASADTDVAGQVTISSPDTISFFLLPEVLKALRSSYPGLEIQLDVLNRISDIQNLEADIAIRGCLEPPSQLIGRKIGSVRFCVCASSAYINAHGLTHFLSADNATATATAAANDCLVEGLADVIVLDSSFRQAPFAQWFGQRIPSSATVTTVNGLLAAWSLCKEGMGVTLLPEYLVKRTECLQCLTTDALPPSNELWILGHSDFRDTERVRVVRQFLYDKLQPAFAD